jgi:tRNA pseudouridine32 synthase/23S rRNA pseudouridine746 synthase
MPLDVVYADDAIVVLNKPSGLLAVPGKTSNECLSLQVQAEFPDALIVHRLDQATSGLMVMARGIAVQRNLNAAFSERRVHKRYEAVVDGDCRSTEEESGWQTIDLPILVDWPNRPLRKIDPVGGKHSTTRWRCLYFDPVKHTSHLELEPITGRSHQLRVHMKAIGHPILGDALYAPPAVAAASERLLLHAAELGFAHPTSGTWIPFHLSADFARKA